MFISKLLVLRATQKKLPTYLKFARESISSSVKFINTDTKAKDAEKYTPVYYFPYIKMYSAINRLKFYHTILANIAMPVSVALYLANIINSDVLKSTCIAGFSGFLIFYSIGAISYKFIGIIYINENENKVKLSYLDFWGVRKDIILPIEDIIPLSDMPVMVTDAMYRTFTRVSTKDTLKLNLKQGKVLDQSKFNKIFGSL